MRPRRGRAAAILKNLGVPLLIHQPKYNLFNRWVEPELLSALTEVGAGCIPFSPLAQGLLTNRYLAGLPTDSRAVKSGVFLKPGQITAAVLTKIQALNEVATARGATLAQLATPSGSCGGLKSPASSSAPARWRRLTTSTPV
jgi:L-glyceraldehyde 3-phosphate reductase